MSKSRACPTCSHMNPLSHEFCGSCGASLAVTCRGCGTHAIDGEQFCGHCGSALNGVPGAVDDSASVGATEEPVTADAMSTARGPDTPETRATPRGKQALVAAAAVALIAGAIGASFLLLRSSGGNAAAAARNAVCRPDDADFGAFTVLSEQEIQASAPDERGGWERQLDSVVGQGYIDCDVAMFSDADTAHADYAAQIDEIESGSFSAVLVGGPAHTLSLPVLGDESSAYEFRSPEGSSRHAMIVVIRTGNAVATIRLREAGDSYTAANVQDVAHAVMGRLASSGYGSLTQPPAAEVEKSALQPVAPRDAVSATRTLALQVGDMNDAQAALVQALTSNTASAEELAQLQSTLAARSIAVGRSADLLVDTAGQQSGDVSDAAVAMYRDVATVAYAQALLIADATLTDLNDVQGRAEMIQSITALSLALSAGEPEHRAVFEAALGSSYEDNVIAVTVPVTDGDARPEAVVTRSRARIDFTVDDLSSLVTPEGVSAAALNAASDPASGATLAQMKAVAAARLSLHAEPARLASARRVAAPSKPLSFQVAKRIVMSRGVNLPDSDATLTFFALADQDDLMEVFSFLGKGSDAAASPNEMILQAALSVLSNDGDRSDRPDVALLTAAILGKSIGSKKISDATAASLQRLLFDQYLQLKEPTISVTGARFIIGGVVRINLSYEVHHGWITVTCQLSDGAQGMTYLDRISSARTLDVRVNASGVGRWSYNCWSLYGQIGGGEVEDAGRPDAATPTATPRPQATPTSQPTPDPCPISEDAVSSAASLFEECPTSAAPVAPPPPPPDTPTPCPPSSGGYDPAGGLASGGPGC